MTSDDVRNRPGRRQTSFCDDVPTSRPLGTSDVRRQTSSGRAAGGLRREIDSRQSPRRALLRTRVGRAYDFDHKVTHRNQRVVRRDRPSHLARCCCGRVVFYAAARWHRCAIACRCPDDPACRRPKADIRVCVDFYFERHLIRRRDKSAATSRRAVGIVSRFVGQSDDGASHAEAKIEDVGNGSASTVYLRALWGLTAARSAAVDCDRRTGHRIDRSVTARVFQGRACINGRSVFCCTCVGHRGAIRCAGRIAAVRYIVVSGVRGHAHSVNWNSAGAALRA